MRPFGEAKFLSGHQTLQLMRKKALWGKGKRVRCHTPCLPKGRQRNPIGSQRIHSTCSPTDFIFLILESGGKGSLFCNGKKRSRFDSAQPNDTSNTNDLCLECVARSLF
ncbi:hypothetical protein EUTSA_v10023031mg [Eutrema salsugineum]|uniref:Uncharacterized protein n=1 Tax=Eutrema salsugineum TaxID=72664 RepID=V4NVV3_EUTSA|nr:hypothetical protein EUTSA_v10023031mg [Eutrema salsugineum]